LKHTSPQQKLHYFLRQARGARALSLASETPREREGFLKIAQFWLDLAHEADSARNSASAQVPTNTAQLTSSDA
jgi:hypothetical protein